MLSHGQLANIRSALKFANVQSGQFSLFLIDIFTIDGEDLANNMPMYKLV